MSSGNWHSCKWQTIQRHLSSRHTSFSEHWSTRPLANPRPFTLKTACRSGWKRDVKATLLLTRLVSEAYQQPNFLTAICPHSPGTNTYEMEQGGLTNIGPSTWAFWFSRKGSGVQDIRLSFQKAVIIIIIIIIIIVIVDYDDDDDDDEGPTKKPYCALRKVQILSAK